jgi:hypothetical protein
MVPSPPERRAGCPSQLEELDAFIAAQRAS